MSVAEDVEAFLGSGAVPAVAASRLAIIVEDRGDDAAILRCNLPMRAPAMQLLGQEVAPALERAGFRVHLEGGLRTIPGPGPRDSTGERAGNKRAYEQRDREEPSLRVTR